jgi:hypothetical protein
MIRLCHLTALASLLVLILASGVTSSGPTPALVLRQPRISPQLLSGFSGRLAHASASAVR